MLLCSELSQLEWIKISYLMIDLKNVMTIPVNLAETESNVLPFDYVVIGAGTSGLILTSELLMAGKKVLLLESGPLALLNHVNNTELRYDSDLIRTLQREFSYTAATPSSNRFGGLVSCFGGKGLFWNGASPRFLPDDIQHWPINYDDLAPYYQKAEKAFHVNTTFGDSRLTRMLITKLANSGIPAVVSPYAVDVQPTEHGILSSGIGNGLSIFSKSGALTMLNKSLRICSDCFVDKLLLNDKGTKVAAIVALDRVSGQQYTINTNNVILAAGAYESTRIALASSLPDPEELIGKYITEHIYCRGYFNVPVSYYQNTPEIALIHIRETPYQLEVQAPTIRIMRIRDSSDWLPDAGSGYRALIRSFGSVSAKRESCLKLTSTNGPGEFIVDLVYDEADEALKSQMQQEIEKVRVSLGFESGNIELLPSGSSYHECGGLRMSDNMSSGICDKTGHFFAVPNLVSADTASWPSLPCANPHLTIAALAYYKTSHLNQK